jgi:hypothetical protein
MACALDEAFDRARNALPDDWILTEFKQDSMGWTARAASIWLNTYPQSPKTVGSRGRTLTKALENLAEKLESHGRL